MFDSLINYCKDKNVIIVLFRFNCFVLINLFHCSISISQHAMIKK